MSDEKGKSPWSTNECMTIVYQNGPDVRFNFDYYVNTHMPLIMRLYGKSISRFELRRGQPGADGAAPPYVATAAFGSPTAPRSTPRSESTKPACAPTCRSSRTPC